jgi:hypothetical protein
MKRGRMVLTGLFPTSRRSRVRRRTTRAALAAFAIGAAGLLLSTPAAADGPTTFTNSAPITITTDVPAPPTPATPYPSTITVSGMTGPVSDVDVRLNGFTHGTANDVDLLLVGPSGANLVLLSDPGDPSVLVFASNATVTFDDSAPAGVPQSGSISGTVSYRPTDNDAGAAADSFPSPAPAPSSATTLGTFAGTNPNGTWSLYVVDDLTGDAGSITGGWSVTITTSLVAEPTTTTVTSSVNPSTVGQAVTFTATVTSGGGNPVTTGTVTFTEGPTTLAANVPVNASGQTTFSTSALTAGSHTITATYNGTAAFQTSSGSVTQVVQRATTSTTLTSSPNPSTVGQAVTFTATVANGGGNPVTTGIVDFTDGGAILATVALDSSGQATLTTATLTEGTHAITATYGGTVAFLPSSGSVTQVVQSGAPACADNAGSTSEDVQLADSLACIDPNGDSLTYAEVAGPSNGTLQLNPDGSFTYDPDPDFNGTDSFTFSANDGTVDSNVATYTVSVGMANDAPILGTIGPQMATEGSTVRFTATASDIDLPPDTLTFSLVGGPSGATIDPNSGVFSWFAPDDGISTFDVCVSDGSLSDCESVTMTVTNIAPTVTLAGPATAVAGQTLTYTYTITDPGADTHTVIENCGAGAVLIDTPTLNSFDCQFAAGPATTMVSVTSDDGGESNALGTASVDVTVAAAASGGAGTIPNTAMPAQLNADVVPWIVGAVLISCLALLAGGSGPRMPRAPARSRTPR